MLPQNYLLTLVLHNCCLALILWVLGEWVVRRGVKVNYTRKLNHLALFVLPFAIAPVLPYEPNAWTITTSAVVFVATTLVFHSSVRSRLPIVETAFASIDRPEDRPYTLLWIVTQSLGAYVALVGIFLLVNSLGRPELIAIPLLVTAFGDGLAEPIGIRFGRHKYRVRSWAADRIYVRSLEGSACVFVVAIAIIFFHYQSLSSPQLWTLLVLLPPIMTITEALSPHSWDAPFLYAAGGGTVAGVLTVLPVVIV